MILNTLKTKVCIVGSGFCGYTVYKKLKDSNIDLILVEGGDISTPNSESEQSFYKIFTNKNLTVNNKIKLKNKLDPSFYDRKFTLGGSSECWTGYIKPFEESTYENNYPNNKNQSWGNLRLNKYKREVLSLLNSPIRDFNPYELAKQIEVKLPKLSDSFSYTTYAWASEPLRLKKFWIPKILNEVDFSKKNRKKDVISGYKLDEFKSIGNKLKSLIFNSKNGKELIIEADYFFLCMGGIENARFVNKISNKNLSEKLPQSGLCNFQEHPHFYNIAHFNKGEESIPMALKRKIKISDDKNKFANKGSIKFAILAWDGPGTPKATFTIYEQEKGITNYLQNLIRLPLKRTLLPNSDYWITMRCEQTPSNSSNLNFGSKKTSLKWNLIDSDFKYYSNYLKRFGSFLMANNFAKDFSLSYDSKDNQAIPTQINGGAHHMGTVPYTQDELLINEKFKLSFAKNTYVVGSSAFPISGFENPTHAAMATCLAACEDVIEEFENLR